MRTRRSVSLEDSGILQAALEGLLLQRQRLEEQIQHVRSLLQRRRPAAGRPAGTAKNVVKRVLSSAARKRISDAQKKRWAEFRKKASASKSA